MAEVSGVYFCSEGFRCLSPCSETNRHRDADSPPRLAYGPVSYRDPVSPCVWHIRCPWIFFTRCVGAAGRESALRITAYCSRQGRCQRGLQTVGARTRCALDVAPLIGYSLRIGGAVVDSNATPPSVAGRVLLCRSSCSFLPPPASSPSLPLPLRLIVHRRRSISASIGMPVAPSGVRLAG